MFNCLGKVVVRDVDEIVSKVIDCLIIRHLPSCILHRQSGIHVKFKQLCKHFSVFDLEIEH